MSTFLQYSNVYPEVRSTILNRAGNNLAVSQLKPWIRISSSLSSGLVVASNLPNDTFGARYGDPITTKDATYPHTNGRLGVNFNGTSIYPYSHPTIERANRPSPVIETITISNGTEGLSRKLNFAIKAFTLPQLDSLTAYFLEPRFYLLVEWGNNTQLAYNQMANLYGGIDKAVCEMISYVNLGVLKDKRKNSKGHYDAFLGVITGGGVDYGSDETYIINVEVTTQGEIPAYFQQHKGTSLKINSNSTNAAKSSAVFDTISEIQAAEKDKDYGKALFMYMYNDLPLSKRTERIKQFIDNPKWAAEYNFVNMNKTTRDKLIEGLNNEVITVKNKDGTVGKGKVPEGQPLVGKERFIRMELAWEILNTTDLLLEPQIISCNKGKSNKSLDSTISIENTIIRGHKHIFSTDKRYLYIPNKNAPDFGLYDILTGNATSGSSSFISITGNTLATQDLTTIGLPDDRCFPQTTACTETGAKVYDESIFSLNQDPYEWGYLKDLFINFDFFCECMQRSGHVIKDVALDILNGLSSAVNLFWDFQIVENGSVSSTKDNIGDMCLTVVDKNFSGKPPGSTEGYLTLQSIGSNSPFLDFKIKLEVAGAMANQVMAQTNNNQQNSPSPAQSSYNIDDKVENFQGLFSSRPDRVGSLLHTIYKESLEAAKKEAEQVEQQQKTTEEKLAEINETLIKNIQIKAQTEAITLAEFEAMKMYATGLALSGEFGLAWDLGTTILSATVTSNSAELANQITEGESRKETQQRNTNYEIFMQKAGVYPKINNPNVDTWDGAFQNEDSIVADESQIVCAVWEDTQLLRQIYEYDLTNQNIFSFNFGAAKNPGYLPVEVNFTIHGVSGLKIGDLLHFVDLPRQYRTKLFTVFQVEHSVNDDMWQTNVIAKLRPISIA